jgi:hypothetical protein
LATRRGLTGLTGLALILTATADASATASLGVRQGRSCQKQAGQGTAHRYLRR